MDNKPLNVAGEVAAVADHVFDDVLFTAEFLEDFRAAFGRRADATNMARPVRPEDVDHFAREAAGVLMGNMSFQETLVSLLRAGICASMEPK